MEKRNKKKHENMEINMGIIGKTMKYKGYIDPERYN